MSGKVHKVIAGRRCLWAPAAATSNSSEKLPPVLILGGTAQSIRSWELLHVPHFTRAGHDTLVMECRGQGIPPVTTTTQDMYADMTLERHVADVHAVLQEALSAAERRQVDVLGFSFGARVALAFAARHSNWVRKLHLTGVGDARPPHAQLILQSWVAMLQKECKENDNPPQQALVPFAYSALLWTYSEAFLAQQGGAALETWVELLCQANTVQGLLAILQETTSDKKPKEEWTERAMAQRVAFASPGVKTQVCIGSLDKIASVEGAQKLAQLLSTQESAKEGAGGGKGNTTMLGPCFGTAVKEEKEKEEAKAQSMPPNLRVFDKCGHAVPLEQAREWRRVVFDFLSSP